MLRSKPYMTFDDYLHSQTYYEQVWTGASLVLFFLAGALFYSYCIAGQNFDRMMDRFDMFVMSLVKRRPILKEGFDNYGAKAAPRPNEVPLYGATMPRPNEVRIGLDLDDPESPKDRTVLNPQVWHPKKTRRQIVRATSAPVFSVPLSPSDEPKKIW